MLAGMHAVGLDPDALTAAVGFEAAHLTDPDRYLAASSVLDLWTRAARADEGDDLGLRVGAAVPVGALEVVDYLIPSCGTIGEAVEAIQRFSRVGTTNSHFRVERSPGAEEIHLVSHLDIPGAAIHDQARDYVFTILIRRLRYAASSFRPLRVEFRGRANTNAKRYTEVLGGPTTFGHENTTIVMHRDAWELPIENGDAVLRRVLERHASDLVKGAPAPDLVDRARNELTMMLGASQTAIATLAKRLGMSGRTLQRRLKERGVPYSTLLDEARFALARIYLPDTALSLDEVSELLGYSEPRAFARAFRRWTGQTPAAYRRAIG